MTLVSQTEQLNNTSHWKALQGIIMDRAREVERLHEDATRTPSASSSQGMLVAAMAKGQYRKLFDSFEPNLTCIFYRSILTVLVQAGEPEAVLV